MMNVKIKKMKKHVSPHFPVWTRVGRFLHLSSTKGRTMMKEIADRKVDEELKKGMFPHEEGIFPDGLIFGEEFFEEYHALQNDSISKSEKYFHGKMVSMADEIVVLNQRVTSLKKRISGFGSPRLQQGLKDKIANYTEFVESVQKEYDSLMEYWNSHKVW